ncbi:MAG: YwaF family protein [Oryzihumus sp.]
MSSPLAYWTGVALGALVCVVLCVACCRWPGGWTHRAGRIIALLLAADAVTFVISPVVTGRWSVQTSLPLALCDVALIVAAVACWFPQWALAVELTWFWGLTGTLQAVLTPDLTATFPELEFFEFVIGHVGIVVAAFYLVVGLRRQPRRGSVARVFAITVAWTALVGVFDWLTGSNYMFLAAVPEHASLLSVLGPGPWYILSAAGVALVMLLVLDAPFRLRGARSRR